MDSKDKFKNSFLGFSLIVGSALLGFFIFKGLKSFSDNERYVAVKGLAEMEIMATSATINIEFSFSGDNVQELSKKAQDKKTAISNYLVGLGYEKNDINDQTFNIEDKLVYYSTEWINGKEVKVKIDRYTLTTFLVVKQKDIKVTDVKVSQIKIDLINQDLTSTITANYTFPELNLVKPKLIAESTKNARIAGEQFAIDSKSNLGKIKTASQGQISIVGVNTYEDDANVNNSSPTEAYIQKVRVVSTIVFFLE